MRQMCFRYGRTLAICTALAASSSCATVGPASISSGRAAYTDVITRTNDEQLLNTLVRMRYAETTTMLLVSAVTTQSELSLNTGIQTGTGSAEDAYSGNIVPFNLSGGYRDTPTISYTPLNGEKYLKQLVTPISLDLYGLLVDSSRDTEAMLHLLTRGIAEMDSPVQYESPSAANLAQAITLMGRLRRAGQLSFAYDLSADEKITGVDLVVQCPAGRVSDDTKALMDLFGKPVPEKGGTQLRFPLQMGPVLSEPNSLHLQTRSTLELLQLASSGVEVPQSQLQSGIAPADEMVSAKPFLHVHSGITAPDDPFVAVQYRGHWFWVDSTDIPSKRGFVAMQTLLMSCLNDKESSRLQLSLPIN